MKHLVTILFFISTTSHADSLTCQVNGSTSNSVVAQLDANKRGVNSIDYIHEVQNTDGTLSTQTQRIYSRWPVVRGELTFDYCNPNENEYRDYSTTYSIYSVCNSLGGIRQIGFRAKFKLGSDGTVSFPKADEVANRTLVLSNCQSGN